MMILARHHKLFVIRKKKKFVQQGLIGTLRGQIMLKRFKKFPLYPCHGNFIIFKGSAQKPVVKKPIVVWSIIIVDITE